MSVEPAILVLSSKTYGKQGYGNKAKYLYKCYPHKTEKEETVKDETETEYKKPDPVLVAYKPDLTQFSKKMTNKYVLIERNKVSAKIVETIGPVDDFESFCTYQLHCRDIAHPISSLNKSIKQKLKIDFSKFDFIKSIDTLWEGECELTDRKIYTMDPKGSKDFDDAFSIQEYTDTFGRRQTMISVYITNVPLVLDSLGLFPYLSERVSTVYFPRYNKSKISSLDLSKRAQILSNDQRSCNFPMLPNKLSENLCSLTKGSKKLVYVMDIESDCSTRKFYPAIVTITDNLDYDTTHPIAKKLIETVLLFNENTEYQFSRNPGKLMKSISNTHEAIEFIMLLMNASVGKTLDWAYPNQGLSKGIFRTCSKKPSVGKSYNIDPELSKFLSFYNSSGSKYTQERDTGEGHVMLNIRFYTHITSPIRRLVDLLNLITVQEKMFNECVVRSKGSFCFSKDAIKFRNSWLHRLDYINEQHKQIRKVQTQASLLKLCYENEEKIHEGFVIDHDVVVTSRKFSIYLPEIKMVSSIFSENELELYKKYQFKIYIFEDEATFNRKVVLELVH